MPSELDGEGTVDVHDRSARSRRRHVQAGRRGAQARWLSVRLPPAALHVPREVAHEGRRHLSAAASLGVLAGASSSTAKRLREALSTMNAGAARCQAGGAVEASADGRVVFTNGVFDLLHPGHSGTSGRAREGDALIVGRQLRSLGARQQGSDRPIVREDERAELMAALASVDAVVIFDEDTPAAIIRAHRARRARERRRLAGRSDRRPRQRRGARRPRRACGGGAGYSTSRHHREDAGP